MSYAGGTAQSRTVRFDYDGVRAAINERTKLVTIQRSKGYATRPTLSVKQIGELIAFVKSITSRHHLHGR